SENPISLYPFYNFNPQQQSFCYGDNQPKLFCSIAGRCVSAHTHTHTHTHTTTPKHTHTHTPTHTHTHAHTHTHTHTLTISQLAHIVVPDIDDSDSQHSISTWHT